MVAGTYLLPCAITSASPSYTSFPSLTPTKGTGSATFLLPNSGMLANAHATTAWSSRRPSRLLFLTGWQLASLASCLPSVLLVRDLHAIRRGLESSHPYSSSSGPGATEREPRFLRFYSFRTVVPPEEGQLFLLLLFLPVSLIDNSSNCLRSV